jgi:hypothetical protein
MASAERESIYWGTGASPPVGVQGKALVGELRAKPLEADEISAI